MNYIDAFSILEIDISNTSYNNITLEYLKKKYHMLALQNHPDKNGNTSESKERFQKINEAYNYLKREIYHINLESEHFKSNNDNNSNNNFSENNSDLYTDFLQLFLKSILKGDYNEVILKIIKDIVSGFTDISIKIFDGLDKDTAFGIYTFLSKYKHILHLSEIILDKVRIIVLQKYDNVQLFKLNPSINDLLNNNVYKLYIDNELYLVPLWYNECYFNVNGKDKEIIVICEPELPSDIKIDEDNNIYIEVEIFANNDLPELIINNQNISVLVGDKIFDIPVSELYMKKEQYYRIKNKGLAKCKDDIYDISEKADIIVKILII